MDQFKIDNSVCPIRLMARRAWICVAKWQIGRQTQRFKRVKKQLIFNDPAQIAIQVTATIFRYGVNRVTHLVFAW